MELNKIVVLGAGTMGRGIAQWFVQQKCLVHLVDTAMTQAESGVRLINESWKKLETKGKFTQEEIQTFERLLKPKSFDQIESDTDLVVEAVFEEARLKQDLFSKLDKLCSSETYFSSNTSSIPIAVLAKELSPLRKERMLGLHFFNPAPVMKLVEIIPSPWTKAGLCQEFKEWFEYHEKKVAFASDTPGFIVNRVARNFYGEAFRIAGSYNKEKMSEVDAVMREVGGFAMGPFELMDLIGIDVNFSVTQSVWEAYFREPRFAPHPIQKLMVDSGRLGRKVKEGFYRYGN